MAKAWKIKHSFWWAVHQTCILDCTLFQNWEHLGRRCITYLNATRHISVCLNIPIYSKTVSALLEWIMDGKSRRWVISYDTIRFCLSQYVSLWDWDNLSGWCWTGKLMSNPDLRNTTLHLILRQNDPQYDTIKQESPNLAWAQWKPSGTNVCCQLLKLV